MEDSQIIHMANQIAMFFSSYPHDEALAGVTSHLKQFWERRMRDQSKQYVAQGGAGLHELALEAVKRLA